MLFECTLKYGTPSDMHTKKSYHLRSIREGCGVCNVIKIGGSGASHIVIPPQANANVLSVHAEIWLEQDGGQVGKQFHINVWGEMCAKLPSSLPNQLIGPLKGRRKQPLENGATLMFLEGNMSTSTSTSRHLIRT